MYREKELFYGPGTPIYLRPASSTSDKDFTIPGQVLLCQLKQQSSSSSEGAKVQTSNIVLEIKAALAHENARILRLHKPLTESQHISTVTSLLKRLLTVDMTNELLTSTKISGSVSKFKSYENKVVASLAKNLLAKWHSVNDSAALAAKILASKLQLETNTDLDELILNELYALHNMTITLELLKSTQIGATVASLKKSMNGAVSLLAEELVAKWKEIASKSEQTAASARHCENNNDTSLDGEVKKGEPAMLVYTVKVTHDDMTFHIEENVALDHVRYRGEVSTNEATTAAAKESQGWEEPSSALVSSKLTPITRGEPPNPSKDDTSPRQLVSDLHSSESSHKRKIESEHNLGQSKRSCSIDGSALGVGIAPKQLDPFSDYSTQELRHYATFHLKAENITHIVGHNGQTIKEIEWKSQCKIQLPRKGENQTNNMCAEIFGSSESGVEMALKMIKAIINAQDSVFESHVMYCRVFLPTWLVYDEPSKARLHCE